MIHLFLETVDSKINDYVKKKQIFSRGFHGAGHMRDLSTIVQENDAFLT